ncbi:N-acetyl-alpha-D-glucosaminyl L-malate synthase [bacterium HR13]|nr:N-acetyl-alpha-D-glucosaminyl L-malate synthase [bacterium HR13]
MKILWLNGNPNPNFGGTEIHTLQMVKELKKEGIDVLLVCARDSYVDKHTEGVEKYHISFPNSLALISTIRLTSLARRRKVDFLIANNGKEYLNALLAGRLSGAKVVFFRHMEKMKQWAVRKLVFPHVDLFLAVSKHVKENLIREGVNQDRIRVIYNVVDEGRFYYQEKQKDPVELVFVGKLDEGKGVMDFLEAFYRLSQTDKRVRAWIVGDGRLRQKVRAFITERGLQYRVFTVGYTPKVEDYYRMAHICVIPSKETEAFPRVALEALACGCALVVSDIGGIKEAVEDGYNGFVFKAGNVEDLTEKMALAVRRWIELSQNALSLYRRKFSRDKVVKDFIEALESLKH